MSRSTLPAEDCVFRLDYRDKFRQAFPMTFNGVSVSSAGFTGGTITAHLPATPVCVEVKTDISHLIEAHEHSSGLVAYSGTTLTIDCSEDNVQLVSIYSRELTTQEKEDRYNAVTFKFQNETPTPTQQAYIDWEDGLVVGRSN